MNGTVVIVSACDFPNGLAAPYRIRMFARAFAAAGHSPTCVFQYAPGVVQPGLNRSIAGIVDGVPYCYPIGTLTPPRGIARMLWYKTWGLFAAVRHVRKLARSTPVSVVFSYGNSGFEDFFYARLAHAIGARFIVEICDAPEVVVDSTAGWTRRIRQWIKHVSIGWRDRHLLPRADGLFLISRFLRDYYARVAPHTPQLLTPIIGDKEEFHPAPNPHGGPVRLAWLGNFRAFEGLDTLVETLDALRTRTGNFRCDVYGVTPKHQAFANEIQEMIERRGLTEHVALHPAVPRSEVAGVLARADILLIPRDDTALNRSNFPTKLVDYLFSGRPVVSSSVGEIPAYCKDGEHILYPAENTPEGLAAAVAHLIANPMLAERIGAGGRRLAEEHFDFRRVGESIRQFLGAA